MSLVHDISTARKPGKWSYKSKKGLAMYFTWPLPVTLMKVQQMEKQGVPLYETWSMDSTKKVVFVKEDIHGFSKRGRAYSPRFPLKRGIKSEEKSMEMGVNFSSAD